MEDNLKEFNPMEEKKLPTGLNVLTILTFIGNGLGLAFLLYGLTNPHKPIDDIMKARNAPNYDSMPEFAKKMLSDEVLAMAQKTYDNRIAINAINLLAIGLCIFGAIQMRKLKMDGYYLYLAGCVLPLIGTLVFLGTAAFAGFTGALMVGFTLLFMILYTFQRKYLIK